MLPKSRMGVLWCLARTWVKKCWEQFLGMIREAKSLLADPVLIQKLTFRKKWFSTLRKWHSSKSRVSQKLLLSHLQSSFWGKSLMQIQIHYDRTLLETFFTWPQSCSTQKRWEGEINSTSYKGCWYIPKIFVCLE